MVGCGRQGPRWGLPSREGRALRPFPAVRYRNEPQPARCAPPRSLTETVLRSGLQSSPMAPTLYQSWEELEERANSASCLAASPRVQSSSLSQTPKDVSPPAASPGSPSVPLPLAREAFASGTLITPASVFRRETDPPAAGPPAVTPAPPPPPGAPAARPVPHTLRTPVAASLRPSTRPESLSVFT